MRHIGAFVLGLWIAEDQRPWAPRNRWIAAGAGLGLVYLVARSITARPLLPLVASWEPENSLTYFYAAFLVELGLTHLPSETGGGSSRALAYLGRASLHIFLFQIAYFGALAPARLDGVLLGYGIPLPRALAVALSLGVCLGAGSVWFALESAVRRMWARRSARPDVIR